MIKNKKKNLLILSALCPLLCNSTRPQHTLCLLTTVAQGKPYHEKPLSGTAATTRGTVPYSDHI